MLQSSKGRVPKAMALTWPKALLLGIKHLRRLEACQGFSQDLVSHTLTLRWLWIFSDKLSIRISQFQHD